MAAGIDGVERYNRSMPMRLVILLAVLVGLPCISGATQDETLARADLLLQSGDAEGALRLAEEILRERRKSAQAHLVRSSARFMLGEREAAIADLDRALELEPSLRQGWLTRGALALSERRYEDAHRAFETARELEPEAADNDLNLGVSQMFLGRIDEARAGFERYVASHPAPAEARTLVAKNYALGGYESLALDQLEKAIARDERQRLLAKTDPAFEGLLSNVRFQRLMSTDSFRPAPDSPFVSRSFSESYDGGRGPLLGAVIDALGKLAIPFDPRIEVTPDWALIWADVRIKVRPGEPGQGVVEVSAAPGRFTERDWQDRVDRLTDQIRYQLAPKIPG